MIEDRLRRLQEPAGDWRVFLLSAHGWSNLGDHLLTATAAQQLREVLKRPVEIFTRQELSIHWQEIRELIRPQDLIVLPGGGNLGDLWIHEEWARRKIVESFPKNAIISFPQSVRFEDAEELRRSSEIYSSHPRLLMGFRDLPSLAIADGNFSGPGVTLTGALDSGLSYEYPFPFLQKNSEEVALILRDDKEKAADEEEIEALKSAVSRSSLGMVQLSTISAPARMMSLADAQGEIYRLTDRLHSTRFLITDRLHGAILGLHARIPVVFFDNSYGKIAGALRPLAKELGGQLIQADGVDPETVVGRALSASSSEFSPLSALSSASNGSFRSSIYSFVQGWRAELMRLGIANS